jgi:hypothetical protein
MKATVKGSKQEYLKDNMPSVQDQLDAILEGGQALADLKIKIRDVKSKIKSKP